MADLPDLLVLTRGFIRSLTGVTSQDIPKVIRELCAKFLVEPEYENQLNDPFNVVSQTDQKYSERFKEEGNEHFRAKQYEIAISKYTTAIQYDPNNHLPFSNRACCEYKLSMYEDAFVSIKRCISIEPAFAKGWHRYALILKQLITLT